MDFIHKLMAQKCREMLEEQMKELGLKQDENTLYLIADVNEFTGITAIPVTASKE